MGCEDFLVKVSLSRFTPATPVDWDQVWFPWCIMLQTILCALPENLTRWWFRIFFISTSIWGRFPFWLYNIFQMGWNHQLVDVFCVFFQVRGLPGEKTPNPILSIQEIMKSIVEITGLSPDAWGQKCRTKSCVNDMNYLWSFRNTANQLIW